MNHDLPFVLGLLGFSGWQRIGRGRARTLRGASIGVEALLDLF
jgi:hypothetical protein